MRYFLTLPLKRSELFLDEVEMGMYGRCCSTSYYALFHAAKAMILTEEDCLKPSRAFDLMEITKEVVKDTEASIIKAENIITVR